MINVRLPFDPECLCVFIEARNVMRRLSISISRFDVAQDIGVTGAPLT